MNIFKKYLIPHEHNQFKPHLLRNETAFAVLALILIIEGAFLSQAVIFGRGSGFLALILPNTLIDETNQDRLAANLPPLAENALLTAAAQKKANDMAAKGYFAHTSPEGITPWYWFQQVGYKYTHAGENLAVNFSDSQDVNNAWMNSPDHRANILNGSYTQIGIASAQGSYQGQRTVFVVQLFGRPPAAKPAPTPIPVAVATPVPTVLPAVTPAAQPTPVRTPVATARITPRLTPRPTATAQPTPEPAAEPVPVVQPDEIALNQHNSVEVEGASTTMTVPAAAKPVTQPAAKNSSSSAAAQAAALPGAGAAATAAEGQAKANMVQRIFASPRLAANIIYLAIGFLIALALILNVLLRAGAHHPQLILNGIMILLALATFAAFNHNLLLANAKIF